MRPDYGSGADELDQETRIEALTVLSEVLDWRRSGPGWSRVTAAVEEVSAGVAAGNGVATRDALLSLEMLSTVRSGRVGDDPVTAVPPPADLVELTTVLQYALRPAAPADGQPTTGRPGELAGPSS